MAEQSFSSTTPDWLTRLVAGLLPIVEEKTRQWGAVITKLGLEEEDRQAWEDIFRKEIGDLLGVLIVDVEQTEEALATKIEELLKQSQSLCKQLRKKMPHYGSENLGLYAEEKVLLETVKHLQDEVDERLQLVRELKRQADEISSRLGRSTIHLNEDPIPTQEDIDGYERRVKKLEQELAVRTVEFRRIKREILEVAGEIGLKPNLDFEKVILEGEDADFAVTDYNMDMLEKFRRSIVQQAKDVRSEIHRLREQLRDLWELLSEDVYHRNEFSKEYAGYSLEVLHALKGEVRRCEALKRTNIKKFVHKIRDDLCAMWDKCKFTQDQRTEFDHFDDHVYTEDLLILHEIELEKVNKFYNENSKIYKLLEKLEDLRQKIKVLDERENAPDRLKNRGGRLLKEEKERNAVYKKIPQVEEQLLQLTAEFEIRTGECFTCWGEIVDTMIARQRADYDQEKKLKLSARKIQRDISTTPGKSIMSVTRTPTANLFGGPSKVLAPSRTPIRTPISWRVPQIKITSATPAKRMKAIEKPSTSGRPGRIMNLTPSGGGKVKLRYSTEKKKRIEKLRRLSKTLQQKGYNKSNETADYEYFQTELSNRESCQSTIYGGEVCPKPRPFTVTPLKPARSATPKSTPLRQNNVKVQSKLTAAQNLNLHF